MVEFKIVDDVVPYLDIIDKVNCNVHYSRQNFEKYIGQSKFRSFFCALEDDGDPVAMAAMMNTPKDDKIKDCLLVAQLSSFKKGYGAKLLRKLDNMFDNLWLAVDQTGGWKLEAWYESVLPQLGWKWMSTVSRWKEDKSRNSIFWIKVKDAEAEKLMVKHISG